MSEEKLPRDNKLVVSKLERSNVNRKTPPSNELTEDDLKLVSGGKFEPPDPC